MMAKKRRKRKPKPYNIGTGSKKVTEETPQEMRKNFPKELVEAFVVVSDLGWSDDDAGTAAYDKYKSLANAFLGDKAQDRIEDGRLVVKLARATKDIRKNKQNNTKKKGKAKEAIFVICNVNLPESLNDLSREDRVIAAQKIFSFIDKKLRLALSKLKLDIEFMSGTGSWTIRGVQSVLDTISKDNMLASLPVSIATNEQFFALNPTIEEQNNVEKEIKKIEKETTDQSSQLVSSECMVSSVRPDEEKEIQTEQKMEERA